MASEKSVSRDPGGTVVNREESLHDQALALAEANRLDDALSVARRAMALDDHDDEAIVITAWVLMRKGDLPGARSLLTRAIALNPDNQEAGDYLATLSRVSAQAKPAKASFLRRTGAHVVDSIIVAMVYLTAVVSLGLLAVSTGASRLPSAQSLAVAACNVLFLGVHLLYFALWESSSLCATPGKLLFRIRVVTAAGERMARARAFGRSAAKILSCMVAGIGCILMLIVPEKNTLHDQLSNTAVICK